MHLPFGKYKGQHVDRVAKEDPAYLEWLLWEHWFMDRYPSLRVYIDHALTQRWGWDQPEGYYGYE